VCGFGPSEDEGHVFCFLFPLDELALQETDEVSRRSPGRYVAMVMAHDDGTLVLTVLRLIVPENTSVFQYEGEDIENARQRRHNSFPINLPLAYRLPSIATSTIVGSWCFLRTAIEPDSDADDDGEDVSEDDESSSEEESSSQEDEL